MDCTVDANEAEPSYPKARLQPLRSQVPKAGMV